MGKVFEGIVNAIFVALAVFAIVSFIVFLFTSSEAGRLQENLSLNFSTNFSVNFTDYGLFGKGMEKGTFYAGKALGPVRDGFNWLDEKVDNTIYGILGISSFNGENMVWVSAGFWAMFIKKYITFVPLALVFAFLLFVLIPPPGIIKIHLFSKQIEIIGGGGGAAGFLVAFPTYREFFGTLIGAFWSSAWFRIILIAGYPIIMGIPIVNRIAQSISTEILGTHWIWAALIYATLVFFTPVFFRTYVRQREESKAYEYGLLKVAQEELTRIQLRGG